MVVPLPIRTSGPIVVYGPTSTLLSSSALGSIMAVGCIRDCDMLASKRMRVNYDYFSMAFSMHMNSASATTVPSTVA